MIVTSLLVKWNEGWHEVTHGPGVARWGRKEGTLGLGAAASVDEVNTVAGQQLNIFTDPRTEIACDVAPRNDSETPIAGYTTGDTIIVPDRVGQPPIRERIQSITATMDDDGRVTYAVELRDVLLDERERMAETITKMANGTLGGDSRVAQPTNLVPTSAGSGPNCCPPMPLTAGALRVVSTRPVDASTASDRLLTPPGSGENYTLTSFRVKPDTPGTGAGTAAQFEFWQDVPGGDLSTEVARVTLGQTWQADVVYVGTVFDTSLRIGSDYGVGFRSSGDIVGSVFCEALFEGAGETITLTWDVALGELAVHQPVVPR